MQQHTARDRDSLFNSGQTDRKADFDCVIIGGGGPSGLVVAKELTEQGLTVAAIESQEGVGGAFRAAYDFMRLVTSNNHIFFSSLPHGEETKPVIWDKTAYIEYLDRFARHYSLLEHIRFSTRATSVRQRDGGGYEVETDDGNTLRCTNVVVCSGVHHMPKKLELEGLESFAGEILHSADVRDGRRFKDKNVLLIGLGESSSDITLEVAKQASTTCISSRGGPGFVIPRYFGGRVTDLDTNRCYHSLPYELFNSWPVKFKAWLERFYANDTDDPKVLKRTWELNSSAGRPWKMRTSTKSTSFVEAMLYHGTQYKGGIDHVEAGRVVFKDGSSFDCDVILDCTGFRIHYPFLEHLPKEILRRAEQPRSMFHHLFIPELGPSLSFVGFIRPAVGAIPPCAEMQARYLSLLLSGSAPQPSIEEMNKRIAASTAQDRDQFPYHFDKVPNLTDYLRFLDGLAREIGCMPPFAKAFFTDPRLWSKLMFATLSGIHYRLNGPGQDYEAARAILQKMPTMPTPVLATELLIKAAFQPVSWINSARRSRITSSNAPQ